MNKYIFYTYGCGHDDKIITCEVIASNIEDAKHVAMMNRIKYDLIDEIITHTKKS